MEKNMIMINFMIFSCILNFVVGFFVMIKSNNKEDFKDGVMIFFAGFLVGVNMLISFLFIFMAFIVILKYGLDKLSNYLYSWKK